MFENGRSDEKSREMSIINCVKNNDALAFVELLGMYSKTISHIANSFSLPAGELDALCQEGRIALFRATQSYDEKTCMFSTYASVCIRNAMTNWAKKYGKNAFSHSVSDTDENLDCKNPVASVEEKVIADELLCAILKGSYAQLSQSERCVLEKKISGKSIDEISKEIGKSTKSVENTLFRARKKIKQKLEN
jgi:RNA polymerase sporulation-specific sigma factor